MPLSSLVLPAGVILEAPRVEGDDRVLTVDALRFVASLVRAFAGRIDTLLAKRFEAQAGYDSGKKPDFNPATAAIRAGTWKVAPLPERLRDRRVEITGPVDRKTIVNALNSGADVFMADFEDATSPTWSNLMVGQANLADAVRRTIDFVSPETGKAYALANETATLMVRPRGLHLPEKHLRIDGRIAPGALVDFGLYFFHNARELAARNEGPYFYLPKLESAGEAALWNDIFVFAQGELGIARGSVRATVLIETLPAAFQMDEILHALREHAAGLNCGRWDYIFSYIKKLRTDASLALPDRSAVTMTAPFLRAYSRELIRTCHRRGASAIGGMAAEIPIKNDPERNAVALAAVRADKIREASDGHDGTWVAHPGLVPIAREAFAAHSTGVNQIDRPFEGEPATAAELLAPPEGVRTERGLRHNVRVGIRYLEAWVRGLGCVPLYDLMEDAATAEISRAQVWQWLHHGAVLEGLGALTEASLRAVIADEARGLRDTAGITRLDDATRLFERLCIDTHFAEFLTLSAYDALSE